MLQTVEVKKIVSNPFNARTSYDEQSIKELADEIKESGFWSGSLRGREKNGKVELCFGHRRLAALKLLRIPKVEVDIQSLSDDEMAMQGLAENLQRRGLNEIDKVDGIKRLAERFTQEQIAKMLGYESRDIIEKFIEIANFPEPVKKLIAQGRISGRAASVAMQFG